MTGKQIEKRFNAFKTAVAILIALALAFIVIALISDTPVKAITTFITGPLQKKSRIGNVLEIMTPLLFTGTAISIMYQANVCIPYCRKPYNTFLHNLHRPFKTSYGFVLFVGWYFQRCYGRYDSCYFAD